MAKKQAAKVVVKKKRWVLVVAPKLFNEREIGEMHVEEPKNAVGRKFSVSVTTLTGEPQKQNIMAKFLITGFVGERLQTELIVYKLNTAATKRLMRRNRSKIDDSIVYTTEDGKKVRVKPMVITRGRAQGGVKSEIRRKMKEHLSNTIPKTQYEQLMREIIQGKFQRTMQDSLRKTHPVAGSEIRHIELIIPKKRV
jgi:small subunit ribosomal protein S3Ae